MRLLTAMLLFGLTGSAIADEAKAPETKVDPKPARLGLRVVKVMPESHQALLYDKNRGTHVLVEVGKPIAGFMVQDIDDEEVTLTAFGASVVLTAPDASWQRRGEAHGREIATMPNPYGPPAVAAPAAAAPAAAPGPVDPYGDVRTAEAPKAIDAGEGGVRVVTPAGAAAPQPIVTSGLRIDPAVAVVVPETTVPIGTPTPASTTDATTPAAATPAVMPATPAPTPTPDAATPTPATPATTTDAAAPAPDAAAPAPTPAPASAPAIAAPAAPLELMGTLGRAEVDRALLDFGKLSSAAKGAFTPTGLRLDKLAETSLYFRAGLRAGDVVAAVDGKPLRSIDDAADLYARSTGVKAAIVSVIRDGKPMTLRVAIQ